MPDRTLVNEYAIAFHTENGTALDFISRYSENAKLSGEVRIRSPAGDCRECT